ncbi:MULTISPECIES: PspA-associated protein PspAB [unclassified Streptomyces]|uniref:PspA-associated protein PspAB n=1 Tax=unclassified Streptomyces TaxID=2593676 RepID=UPI0004C27C2E|nr:MULTISPECIES: hypothetical protein [unclassified Streptomyces]
MGFLDILLGRTKPVAPDLDQLFALSAAAVTLEAGAGFTPTGEGAVCFAMVEGAAFEQTHREVRALLDADAERMGVGVELRRDEYGYAWLVSRRGVGEVASVVNDLHAVNSAMEVNGFGAQLLCSVVGFREAGVGAEAGAGAGRRLGLVYLFKRGTFYPFAPVGGERRDTALELRVRGVLAGELRMESDLGRWFPLWGAPGL